MREALLVYLSIGAIIGLWSIWRHEAKGIAEEIWRFLIMATCWFPLAFLAVALEVYARGMRCQR